MDIAKLKSRLRECDVILSKETISPSELENCVQDICLVFATSQFADVEHRNESTSETSILRLCDVVFLETTGEGA